MQRTKQGKNNRRGLGGRLDLDDLDELSGAKSSSGSVSRSLFVNRGTSEGHQIYVPNLPLAPGNQTAQKLAA